jgi:hypothetical protein
MAVYCYVLINVTVSNKPLLLDQIGWWWRWSVWLVPMFWATLGVGNNEFLGKSYRGRNEMAAELAPDGVGIAFLKSLDDYISEAWRCASNSSFV